MNSRAIERLSEGQRACLRLVAERHEAKEIAAILGLSHHTINERLREAREILGVSRSLTAARLLVEFEGSISMPPNRLVSKPFGLSSPRTLHADPSSHDEWPVEADEVQDQPIRFVPDYPPVTTSPLRAAEGPRNGLSPTERLRQIGEAAVRIALVLALVFLGAILLSKLNHH